MAEPHKSKDQTDQRILGLSAKAFEKEFGFTPADEIEQRHFANVGERLTDPEARKRLEEMAQLRRKAQERRQSP